MCYVWPYMNAVRHVSVHVHVFAHVFDWLIDWFCLFFGRLHKHDNTFLKPCPSNRRWRIFNEGCTVCTSLCSMHAEQMISRLIEYPQAQYHVSIFIPSQTPAVWCTVGLLYLSSIHCPLKKHKHLWPASGNQASSRPEACWVCYKFWKCRF